MGDVYKESISMIQDRVLNAAGLSAVIAAAAYEADPSLTDMGGACQILYDYLNRTADIICDKINGRGCGDEQQGIS